MKKEYLLYSKLNCPSCEQAKDLVKSKGLEYTYMTLDVHFTLQELFAVCDKPPRSFPQVFVDGKLLGGLKELREHLEVSV